MMSLKVDNFHVHLPEDWLATKYDEEDFYIGTLQNIRKGIKAVDVIAVDSNHKCWLIEAKDYRKISDSDENKISPLHSQIFDKIINTLLSLLPARLEDKGKLGEIIGNIFQHANADGTRIKMVLILAKPETTGVSKGIVNPKNIQHKVKSNLKNLPIDFSVYVVGSDMNEESPIQVEAPS